MNIKKSKKVFKCLLIMLFFQTLFSTNILASEKPLFVNFTILGAVVGPTKINGRKWDASFSTFTSVAPILTEMMLPGSSFATSSVINLIAKSAPKGGAAPDVIGYIHQTGPTLKSLTKIAGTLLTLSSRKKLTKNSYFPSFSTGYIGWPIYKNTRFRIKLLDKDFRDDDHIGTVEINIDDIKKAIKAGKPIWINVSEQSMNQLLFISLTATKSLKSTSPKLNGNKW